MGKRGRPSKAPSAEDRAKVAEMLAKEVPIADLAKMFGMTPPTFRKYFHSEFLSRKKIAVDKKPTRTVTTEDRARVSLYLGYGMPPEKVALVVDYIGPDAFEDFKSDFAVELAVADAKTRAMTIDTLVQQSKAGSAAATNKLEMLSRPPVTDDASGRVKPATSNYVSKKEQAKADAAVAIASGGMFAPRAAPRLVASGGKPVDEP